MFSRRILDIRNQRVGCKNLASSLSSASRIVARVNNSNPILGPITSLCFALVLGASQIL